MDKYFTSALLEDAGLPTPRTRVCERLDDALVAFEALGKDVVVKPLFGSEGRGIVRVSDPDLAYRTCRALEVTRSVFYLQEFIAHGGRDIRAFVVGGRLLAAMTRQAPGWKTNVSQGARTEPLVLPEPIERLAVEAAAAAGGRLCRAWICCSADDGRVLRDRGQRDPGMARTPADDRASTSPPRSPSTRSRRPRRGLPAGTGG